MSREPWDGGLFGIGHHAAGAEFRSTDVHGRPVDTASETETARTERILALQDRRMAEGDRGVPSADPAAILVEWMAASPDNRMSPYAQSIAEHPERMPAAEVFTEVSTPQRGGLLERMAAMRRARGSARLPVADLTDAQCTCPAMWRGAGKRPPCEVHPEAEETRRRSVASIVTVNRLRRPRDPEGMGADTWRPYP